MVCHTGPSEHLGGRGIKLTCQVLSPWKKKKSAKPQTTAVKRMHTRARQWIRSPLRSCKQMARGIKHHVTCPPEPPSYSPHGGDALFLSESTFQNMAARVLIWGFKILYWSCATDKRLNRKMQNDIDNVNKARYRTMIPYRCKKKKKYKNWDQRLMNAVISKLRVQVPWVRPSWEMWMLEIWKALGRSRSWI